MSALHKKVLQLPVHPRAKQSEKFGPLATETQARNLRSSSILLKAISDELPKAMASGKLAEWKRAAHSIIACLSG